MKILIAGYSHQLGSLLPMAKLYQVLESNPTNEVYFAGHVDQESSKFLSLLQHEFGITVHNLPELPIHLYRQAVDAGRMNAYTHVDTAYIALMIEEEIRLMLKLRPDIVIDTLRPTMAVSTEILNIPRASLVYGVLSTGYKLGVSIPETHQLYDKFHSIPVLYPLLDKLANYLKGIISGLEAKGFKSQISQIRITEDLINLLITSGETELSTEELQDLHKLIPQQSMLGIMEGNHRIIYDVDGFAEVRRNKNTVFVGSLPIEIPVEIPEWYAEVKAQKDAGKRVVYVTMGSTGKRHMEVLKALYYYLDTPEGEDVIVIGNRCEAKIGGEIQTIIEGHPNIYLENYLPGEKIMEELADVAITHGGRGSMYQAIQYGVPQINIPGQAEQQWNAERVVELQLGAWISNRNFREAELLHYVNFFLHGDPQERERYQRALQDFKERVAYDNEAAPARLNDFLRSILAQHRLEHVHCNEAGCKPDFGRVK